MREATERPEGIAAGTARLVGTDKNRIVSEIFSLLDDEDSYSAMARAHNQIGDGTAARKIAEFVARADRKSTSLNSSHTSASRMPSSASKIKNNMAKYHKISVN